EIGRSQGRTEGYSQVAEKMLKANKPFEEIIEFTGLSEDVLRELAEELGVYVDKTKNSNEHTIVIGHDF
ncbi:MAG: hypothetical protein PUF12_07350, partial [Thermoflexaceae bacterium]|nr:hypothetical protein [Thermoflexaceae bacterium]